MNLYKISDPKTEEEGGVWNRYVEAVVAAEDEDTARCTHPDKDLDAARDDFDPHNEWCAPEGVEVELIGKAVQTEAGVVMGSFRDGDA